MTDILVAGETIVDFLPETTGPLESVETFHRRAGGAPANVAVGLAHLDESVAFWTRVGDDPLGDFLADELTSHGLPPARIERDPQAKTGLAFVRHDAAAERAFSFYHEHSAETRLEPGTVSDETLESVAWVHVDVLSLDTEPARSAILDLAERAQAAGATVSVDANARPERWGEFDYAASVRQAFGLADVVKATPDDLREADFEGNDVGALAEAIVDHGPHTVFLTLGSDGAYAAATTDAAWRCGDKRSGDEQGDDEQDDESEVDDAGESTRLVREVRHDGYAVDPLDTTGAGDAFTAGAIASRLAGNSLDETLAFANAVAARTTTEHGAMTALPTREEATAFQERATRE